MGDQEIFWGDAAAWIGKILDSGSGRSRNVEDFALTMQSGVVLCNVLNKLKAGSVQQIITGSNLRSYQCKQNIESFLMGCNTVFSWNLESLFDAGELYNGVHFGRVISTLSRLSHSKLASQNSSLRPFPDSETQVEIYAPTEDDDYLDESIYSNVGSAMDAKLENDYEVTAKKFRSPMELPTYSTMESAHEETDDDDYTDAKNLYKDSEQIYDMVCKVRTPAQNESCSSSSAREKCAFILSELVETERSYLAGLRTIETRYLSQLSQPQIMKSVKLTNSDLETISANLKNLIPIHAQLLKSLEDGEDVARVFINNKTSFIEYALYSAKLPQAQQKLDTLSQKKEVKQLLEHLRQMCPGRFDLKSMLSLPVQRMLKYPLLLKDLKKQRDLASGTYSSSLNNAIEAVKDIARFMNEVSRDWESTNECHEVRKSLKDFPEALFDNQGVMSFGKLLLDAEVRIRMDEVKAREKKVYLFTFQKTLLVTVPERNMFVFKYTMDLKHFKITRSEFKGRDVAVTFVSDVPSMIDYNCTIIFKTTNLRNAWAECMITAGQVLSIRHPQADAKSPCSWQLTTFDQPTQCSQCGLLLWGLVNQGYRCGSQMKAGCMQGVHGSCIALTQPRCRADVQASTRLLQQNKMDEMVRRSQRGGSKGPKGGPIGTTPPLRTHSPAPTDVAPRASVSSLTSRHSVTSMGSESQRPSQRAPPPRASLTSQQRHGGDSASSDDDAQDYENVPNAKQPEPGPSSYVNLDNNAAAQKMRQAHQQQQQQQQQSQSQVPPQRSGSMNNEYVNISHAEVAKLVQSQQKPQPSSRPTSISSMDGVEKDQPKHAYRNMRAPKAYTNLHSDGNQIVIDEGSVTAEIKRRPWFAGKLSRQEAISRFEGQSAGAFLVRESTRGGRHGTYTMDVCIGNGECKHIPIEREKNSGMYYVSRRKKFISIPDLIRHYESVTLADHFPAVTTSLKVPLGQSGGWSEEMFEVIREYTPQRPRELALVVGQRLVAYRKGEDGWLEGHGPNGQRGMFHISYVASLEV